MAKRRYSKSKKRVSSSRSTRGRRSRHTKRHTRRRGRGRGRGRGRRGGANNPGAPEIMWSLKPNQLLPGLPNYQRGGSCPGGGVSLPTGGYASNKGTEWTFRNPACGRA